MNNNKYNLKLILSQNNITFILKSEDRAILTATTNQMTMIYLKTIEYEEEEKP